jgi:hypothetical protein
MQVLRNLWMSLLTLTMGAGGCALLLGFEEPKLREDAAGGAGGSTSCPPDAVKNGDETGKDCGGGLCPSCPDGEGCIVGTDCESHVCIAGTCRPSTCDDNLQNGAEVDVDCGGPASGCAACPDGSQCTTDPECASGICKSDRCVDSFVWAKHFGRVTGVGIAATATTSVLTGRLQEAVDFGGGTISSFGYGFAIAQHDTAGNHVWSQYLGENGSGLFYSSPAINAQDDISVVGGFEGDINFGGGALTSAGSYDVFIATLGQSGHIWSKRFGDSLHQAAYAVAIDADGNVIATGNVSGSIDFGGGPLTGDSSGTTFVVKLNAAGAHIWSESFNGALGGHVATDTIGNVFLEGFLLSNVDFGGGPLSVSGSGDYYFVKLSSSGGHLWSKSFRIGFAGGIDADHDGNLVTTGAFEGTADFGGGALTSTPADASDIFIAKFGPSGAYLWSRRFGGMSDDHGGKVAVDADGNVVVACWVGSPVDFGGGLLEGAVILKLDPDGNHLWSKSLSDENGSISIADIATPDAEHVIVAGNLDGTFDLGGGPMTSDSGADLILAKLRVP